MNLLTTLENGFAVLGQVLRFPVMALLWICVIAVVLMAGSCFLDFIAQRRERRAFDLDTWLLGGPVLTADESRRRRLPHRLRNLMAAVEKARIEDTLTNGGLEHLVLEFEDRIRRTLNGPRMLVRVGPGLGLIGALISLAAGSREAMAGRMAVACATTIIGLATGLGAYVIGEVRLGWVNESVREQQYLAKRAASELSHEIELALSRELRSRG